MVGCTEIPMLVYQTLFSRPNVKEKLTVWPVRLGTLDLEFDPLFDGGVTVEELAPENNDYANH